MPKSLLNQKVTVVKSGSKLRVQAPDGGWVRFPKFLRTEEGVQYIAQELRPGKAGSWIACGEIYSAIDLRKVA